MKIAATKSEWLGEPVTINMLNNYASEAQVDHTISCLPLMALIHLARDVRLLQIGAEMFEQKKMQLNFLLVIDNIILS